jgi:hypothetical protein
VDITRESFREEEEAGSMVDSTKDERSKEEVEVGCSKGRAADRVCDLGVVKALSGGVNLSIISSYLALIKDVR